MMIRTSTFMILLNRKFCKPCVHFAPSAASRFLLMDDMLLLSARSNLSACMISNCHDRVLLVGYKVSVTPPIRVGCIVHTMVFIPNDWVKMDLILMFTPILVPGLTTKLVIGLDV